MYSFRQDSSPLHRTEQPPQPAKPHAADDSAEGRGREARLRQSYRNERVHCRDEVLRIDGFPEGLPEKSAQLVKGVLINQSVQFIHVRTQMFPGLLAARVGIAEAHVQIPIFHMLSKHGNFQGQRLVKTFGHGAPEL